MRKTLLAAVVLATAATSFAQLAPRKVIAVLDGTKNFGTTQRAVNFYDVTDVGTTSTANVFNQQPMFSIWTGYEDSVGANYEDPDTIAVNPVNGDVYLVAFDSGSAGVPDSAGDTQGDLDLYKLDYQSVLAHWTANGAVKGTMYAPAYSADGYANPQHPSHIGTTVNLAGASTKIGEAGRTQGSTYFDRDIEYINPQTLVYVDNEQDGSDTAAEDHELRLIERVSTSSGASAPDTSDANSILGGYNLQTSESWETDRLALLNMDFVSGVPTGFSEPEDIALATKDGKVGVWVSESDGGGDDVSFFEITGYQTVANDATGVLTTIDSLGNSRSLDENPEADTTTNDGDHDATVVDADGNVIFVESGYFDTVPGGEAGSGGTAAGEPTVLRLNVDQYQSGNVDLNATDAWDDLGGGAAGEGLGAVGSDTAGDAGAGSPAPTQLEGPLGSLANAFSGGTGLGVDDDSNVTDGRFVTLDKGENILYIFDIDSGGLPNVVSDVYAIDLDTGEIVYEELNAANHFLAEHGLRHFLRGDMDKDGDVDADDIDLLASTTLALDAEERDLTSDDLVTIGTGAGTDMTVLVEDVLGTAYGDADLDGDVDPYDLNALLTSYGASSGGWAQGNFDQTNANIGPYDLNALLTNYGFSAGSTGGGPAPIPEPATMALLGLGGLALIRRRRK